MDDLVQNIAKRIADAICPEKIILFGSRARKTESVNSDIDFLIIYNGPLSKHEVKIGIRRLFPKPDFSMDLFVLTSEEFERQKKVVSTVGRAASREGIICHG